MSDAAIFLKQAKDPDLLIELNVTPLIDVLLVLIVMIVLCASVQFHSVNSVVCATDPEERVPETLCMNIPPLMKPEPGDIINIDVSANGDIRVDGKMVDQKELSSKLLAIGNLPFDEQADVRLRPNAGAPYKVVIGIFSSAQRYNVRTISLPEENQPFHKRAKAAADRGIKLTDWVFYEPHPEDRPRSFLDVIFRNPLSDDSRLSGQDVVTMATRAMLLLMGAASWCILLAKLAGHWRHRFHSRRAGQRPWAVIDAPAPASSDPFQRISAVAAAAMHTYREGVLCRHLKLQTWLRSRLGRELNHGRRRMERGLTFLATIGSTATFIGLFGTIWALHQLLMMPLFGQPDIGKLAGPIGEALVTTVLGLLVAVPAMAAFNLLQQRNARAMLELKGYTADLEAAILQRLDNDRRQ